MSVCLLFVTIEIEELCTNQVDIRGNCINPLRMHSGKLQQYCSLGDAQSDISTVFFKIGLSHCFVSLRWYRALSTRKMRSLSAFGGAR